MAHPKDDLSTRAGGLDTLCWEALDLPDVPEPRRELLRAIKLWAQVHRGSGSHVPPVSTAAMASLERQLQFLKSFVHEDRRAPQRSGGPRQNTRADGDGDNLPVTDCIG
ncbi:hypothetical protein [Methylobacterium brachythecii]|uniref:Uncharacterized protein n=1 Tax=Methylobacterium brachythecii TaxID=1176177 RepID=A0A7W6AKU2_9HYPH|nr:hypothetical protein [Methylobacterium brachythecii]MBB3905303.1 hypothetical protein [Methylobacterium brachythecii]GLS45924.1 hypothetical protein GCM10007884_39150 [Methylobacterium brachythecii]